MDDSLVESFRAENVHAMENMGNTIEDLHSEELRGEMIYISKDGVEGSIRESRFDFMNEKRSEKNIVKSNEEVSNKESCE